MRRRRGQNVPVSPEQRQRVLDALSEGRLPLDAPKTMYAGYGTGRVCVGCGEPVHRREVEYEAEYADGRAYLLHLGCASLWDAERRRRTVNEDAERIREEAQKTAKEAAQLRDRADVLRAESQAMREKAKHVKPGQDGVDGG